MSLEELMQELDRSSLPKARAEMLAHATLARKYGLPMIAYEGGQHLWNMSSQAAPELDALFTAANRDPRMGVLYSRYLKDWTEAGGGLFMHLLDCGSFEGAGNWGALEYITQPRAEAPKFDALQRFIEGAALDLTDRNTFDSWKALFNWPQGQSGVGEDPDRDGLPNLIEFALGTNPLQPSAGLPSMTRRNDSFTYSFTKAKAVAGVDFVVETSSDLRNWTGDGVKLNKSDENSTTETWTYEFPRELQARFIRLVVIKR
jgi:hypothetical protein